MTELTRMQCRPRKGEDDRLDSGTAAALLARVKGWTLIDDGKAIERSYRFKNYYETTAFVNALAWVAHRQDHHPDIEVGYRNCRVIFTTHSVDGLSENDFICAARINALLDE